MLFRSLAQDIHLWNGPNIIMYCPAAGQSCRKGPEWRKNVFVYGLHPVTLRRESIPDVPARHPNDSDVRVPYCTSCVENRSAPYNRSEPKPVPESIPSCGSALCRDIHFHTSAIHLPRYQPPPVCYNLPSYGRSPFGSASYSAVSFRRNVGPSGLSIP